MSRLQVGVIGILLLLLSSRLFLFYQNKSKYINGQQIIFQTTLLSEPRISGNQQRLSIVLGDGQRVLVTIPRYPEFHYADTVHVSGYVRVQTPNVPGILRKRVIDNKNTVLAIYSPQIKASKNKRNFVLAITSRIRQKITSLFQETLPPSYSGLLLGITFGIKEDMPKEFFDKLQKTGALHVVAASGMNVTMIGGVLSSLFAVLFRRQVALLCAIFGIFFYALLAGFEPSIVRAAIMGTLVFVAQILGRQYMASYGLFLAALGMLFLDPKLLFDIGFQLSFVATLGLVYIGPLLNFIPKKFLLREDLQTTIAAQIATMPILFANFGTYSLLSVLVNMLILWTVPIVMLIGGVGAVIGLVFSFVGKSILYLAMPFLWYFTQTIELFSKNDFTVTIETFPWQWVVSYYFFLVAFVMFARHKKAKT